MLVVVDLFLLVRSSWQVLELFIGIIERNASSAERT